MHAEDIFLKYKHFLLLLLFIPTQLLFAYCEKVVVPVHIMHTKLDSHIPFIKEFVIPYVFWYIYMIATIIYFGFVSRKDFYRLTALMLLGMVVACIIYLIFPNGQNMRPQITQSDVFSRMIKYLYSVDTPTNVAPSLHVFDSIAIHLGLVNCYKTKDKMWLKVTSFICMILICASTVFIKQHSLVDVFWGAMMAVLLYGIVYGLPELIPDTVKEGIDTI
jgi:PAP2 superfamily.